MQETMLSITVILVIALAALFLWVIRASTSARPNDAVQAGASRIRTPLIWGMLIFGVIITYRTLSPWPHSVAVDGTPIVVTVTGAQWSWDFKPKQVPVGTPVVFAVTSTDVNHGVGIYDDGGRLLTQTQGMPGYINKVKYTFTKPGTYRFLCLEYCGLAHHDMIDKFKVVAR